jgi:uncharacterized RDD family membrane protein YckC
LSEPGAETSGFWIRFLAWIIDALIVAVVVGLPAVAATDSTFILSMVILIAQVAYFTIALASSGSTIGKKVLGMRVVRVNGAPLTVGVAFLRTVANPLVLASIVLSFTDSSGDSTSPWGIVGLIAILAMLTVGVRQDKRGPHDFVAGTVVVRRRR